MIVKYFVKYSLLTNSPSAMLVVVTADISVCGEARMLISLRLDDHHGRARVCDFSHTSVADLYVFAGAHHSPLTFAIIHWRDLKGSHHPRLVIQQQRYQLANDNIPSHV